MKSDITNKDDIKHLVDEFYALVRKDDLLSHIFNGIIQDKWPEHLSKMYRFWQTVLLHEKSYFGNPFMPHVKLTIDSRHFDRWKSLFDRTIDNLFEGEKADEAKWRAEKMVQMFQIKLAHAKTNNSKPLI